MQDMVAHRLYQTQRPDSDDLRGIFGNVERNLDVALGSEVIYFIGVNCFQNPPQSGTVGEIAIMQGQPRTNEMGVMVEMINTIGVEEASAPDQAVHFVAFRKQELRKIRAVLTGNAGNQRALSHIV